ncbi:ATP phosphoribosyltransferase regulatory subunit, partial [Treponema endosymbiont of Eucomonympha sp.]|uniref:ATP phosphoribosyltransferase regulatory subunit n=1 Tax=Treponema endosymbiont of Eucomonympha sp. TaxID=1580831 RepID=UPI00165041C7
MERLIQPRVLKGFRDYLPPAEIIRASLIERLTAVFRAHGFVPIDTPALEYAEILLRKSASETEKQVFRFQDNGGRDVALRFDLTVPFARFVAEHAAELTFPFKRYHIAKVWRGEKPQAGRFREFVQCDFDLVGSESASADFDILSLMHAALVTLGFIFYFILGHQNIAAYLLVPHLMAGAAWGLISFALAGVLRGYLCPHAFPRAG